MLCRGLWWYPFHSPFSIVSLWKLWKSVLTSTSAWTLYFGQTFSTNFLNFIWGLGVVRLTEKSFMRWKVPKNEKWIFVRIRGGQGWGGEIYALQCSFCVCKDYLFLTPHHYISLGINFIHKFANCKYKFIQRNWNVLQKILLGNFLGVAKMCPTSSDS